MRLTVFPLSLLYVLISHSACWQASATFTVSPDSLRLAQCSQVDLLWTEEPPIQLWVAPDRKVKPGDPTLETLGPVNATSYSWTVDLPVGQNVSFTYIRLAEPLQLFTSPQEYTVVAGNSSACLPGANRSSSSSSSAGASSSAKPTPNQAPNSQVPPPSGGSPTSRGADATSTGFSTIAPSTVATPPSAGATAGPNSQSSTKAGAIAGGIAGGFLALCGGLFFLRRRRVLLRLRKRASVARTVGGTEDGLGPHPTRSPPTAQATGTVTVYPFQAVAGASQPTSPPSSHPTAQKWASWNTAPPLHVPDQPQDVPGSSAGGSDLWSPARTESSAYTGSAWADLQTEVVLLRTEVERFQEDRRRQL